NTDWNPWYTLENRTRVLGLLDQFKPFAEKYRCTLAQLVLAWTAAQPGVTHVLAGARRPAQIKETAIGGAIKIIAEDAARIRAAVLALGDAQ
ncbi:MAG: aldo/keto reductase, partial [Tepidisphaeraceae bacterium]